MHHFLHRIGGCIKIIISIQRVVTGPKPSFSVDFAVNEGCFVSNMVVVPVGSKMAIVKQSVVKKSLLLFAKINFTSKRLQVYY